LLVIGEFVVRFLAIHPFQDGNGRLSRALTAFLLLRAGYNYVPYASLESIIEENKEGSYLALRRTQGTLKADVPEYDSWLLFFVRALHTQKSRLEKKIEREQLLGGDLSELSLRILELTRQHGRIKSGELRVLRGETGLAAPWLRAVSAWVSALWFVFGGQGKAVGRESFPLTHATL